MLSFDTDAFAAPPSQEYKELQKSLTERKAAAKKRGIKDRLEQRKAADAERKERLAAEAEEKKKAQLEEARDAQRKRGGGAAKSSTSSLSLGQSEDKKAERDPRLKERGPRKMNSVTGQFEVISKTEMKGKVRDGAMLIDKKYLRAAAEAGLGGGAGMYSHMGAVRREVEHEKYEHDRAAKHFGNMSGAPTRGVGSRPSGKAQKENQGMAVKTTMQGGVAIHSFASTDSGPSKPSAKRVPRGQLGNGGSKSNVKQGVQGRSKRVGGRSATASDSSYMKQKGVVSTLGGCTSAASQRYAEKKAEASRSTGGAATSKPKGPRREAVTRKLGGGKPAQDGMTDAERRAAFFEKRFGKG